MLVLNRHFKVLIFFFFTSRRRHTRSTCDWSSDVCSSDLIRAAVAADNYRPYAVDVQRAELHLAGWWLETRGRASWKDGIRWDGRVAATNIETSALTPQDRKSVVEGMIVEWYVDRSKQLNY